MAGTAFAADMPVKAPPQAIVVAPTWTGFYIGGHGGVAWLRHKQTIAPGISNICTAANVDAEACRVDDTAAIAGGQIGYLWQYQQFVFGVEADGTWTGLKKTANILLFPGFPSSIDAKVEWLTTVRGRLGIAVNDWLLYGTGGVAWASVNAGWQAPASPLNSRLDKTVSGWVAGGGIEKMLSRNWSVRAEYLYYGLRSTTNVVGVPNFTYSTSFRNDVSVVRLGVNFRP